jgi:hypothetical protein
MKRYLISSMLPFLIAFSIKSFGQEVTYARDIAPIIYKNCSTCHRPGEIGPMSLMSYDDVAGWAGTIKYVTSNKIMPPWKADPNFQHYLDENYLSQSQIDKISAWVDAGAPRGDIAEEPKVPDFPQGSLLGTPDLKLSFAKAYTHKGNGKDEYRYFVIPSGVLQNKKLKAIEMRPGNARIVHHALFFADNTGKARNYDNQTPEYGFGGDDFADFGTFEVINRTQYPGYVPGQKPRYFPDGLAQDFKAGTDLVIQIHYAPTVVDEVDSSSVNIFFADDSEVITREVSSYIMLPTNLPGGFNGFFIPGKQVKTFEGTFTSPVDASLIGIFPHMHLLGKKWEVRVENPDGTKSNLIKIDDWDFNWQGGYSFKKYIVIKKGAKVKAFATYDNTSDNPSNPNNPPKLVTWGEGTKDEMYYLPLQFVPYQVGDENVIFEPEVSATKDHKLSTIKAKVYPNPISSKASTLVQIEFELNNGGPVDIQIADINGKTIRRLREREFFATGSHLVHWSTQDLSPGQYYVQISHLTEQLTLPVVIID